MSPRSGRLADIAKHFNKTTALSVILVAVSQFNYGFENQAFAATQAMGPFTRQFGTCSDDGTCAFKPKLLSLLNSLPFIGFAIGLWIGSMISSHFGRRKAMFFMSLYALISATVVNTAQTYGHLLTGRILNHVYVGWELATVPVYQSELVPGPVRGLAVATYQLSILLGGFVINGICRGTSEYTDRRSYAIPFGLFFIIPVIIASCIFLIPESPRWLLTKDQVDKARECHHKLRVGTMTEEAIETEFQKLQDALKKEPEQGHTIELFQGVNLKRTAIVLGVNFFQQATGQTFSSQYGAIFIRDLNTVNPFSMTFGMTGMVCVVLIIALLTADRVGRRYMLESGAFLQAVGMFVMAGLGLKDPVPEVSKRAIIGMLFLTGAGFGYGWGPVCYVVTTEMPALRLRDRSQRVASLMNIFMNFLTTFIMPYLLYEPYAALNSKVGFIFGSIAVLAIIFTFFCVPECKGRSLEEVDRMFNEGVPIRKFRNHPRIHFEGDAAAGESLSSDGDVEAGHAQKVEVEEKPKM